MISSIKISALKSIDDLEVNCSKLNIITGTNSSGKSTFIQGLLLFAQTHSMLMKNSFNGLNGQFVSLGEYRENKNYNVSSNSIDISVNFDNCSGCKGGISFFEDDTLKCVVQDYGSDIDDDFQKFCSDVNKTNWLKYLSCNRIGAQDVYLKQYAINGIGQEGENAIYFLEQNKSKIVAENLIKDHLSETLVAQVNYWLDFIVNTVIRTEDIIGTDVVKASYSVGENRNSRPKNVGSGISYLISILILCLSSDKNDILIVENPEIHLHPKAQSRVCEFLYFIAKSGRQIFIETHSDHIFNGIRAGIATGDIVSSDVAVNFFELDERNCTKNTVIKFGVNGQIEDAPSGLFDQFDSDLDRMLGLK